MFKNGRWLVFFKNVGNLVCLEQEGKKDKMDYIQCFDYMTFMTLIK